MISKASIEFTREEAEIVVQFLRTTSMKGSLETLPTLLSAVANIIQKFDAAFNPPAPAEVEVRPQENPKPKRRRH